MTDITELAHSKSLRKKLNRRLNDAYGFQRTSGGKHTTISLSIDECKSVIAALEKHLALVEALEKAKGMEIYWKTQCRGITDHCEKLQAQITAASKQEEDSRNTALRQSEIIDLQDKRNAELDSHKAALLKFISDSCYIFDGFDADISDAYVDAITSGLMPKLESVAACNPPLFWVRVKSDGGYDGPIHDSKLEDVRKKSGEWLPLTLARGVPEQESRTVTVKLPPKIERNDIDGWFTYKGGRVGGGAAEWYNKALDDVGSELTATGIKWEAE